MPATEESHCGGERRFFSRFLFSPFPCPETRGKMETHNRLVRSKCLSKSPLFQDGDSAFNQDVNTTRRLGYFVRPHGRLPSYPNTRPLATLPTFCSREQGIHVSSAAFRPLSQPMDLYQSYERSHDLSQMQDFFGVGGVSRRYTGQEHGETALTSGQRLSSSTVRHAGFHRQSGEIRAMPQTMFRSPGHEFRFTQLHSRPDEEEDRQSDVCVTGSARCRPFDAQRYRPDGRSVPGSGRVVTAGPTASAAPAVGRNSVVSAISTVGLTGTNGPVILPCLTALDRPSLASYASAHSPDHPHAVNLHRRLVTRVGSSSTARVRDCQWQLDARGTRASYQRARNVSSTEGATTMGCVADRSICSDSLRQLYGSDLHQQTRGHQIREPVPVSNQYLAVCATTLNRSAGPRHIPGRLNVLADGLSRRRVFATEWTLAPATFSWLLKQFPRMTCDLFATRLNAQLPRFISPFPDPTAIAVDAISAPWIDRDVYAFPPTPLIPRVLSKLENFAGEMTLIAPLAPHRAWFSMLLDRLLQLPLLLPVAPDMLRQPLSGDLMQDPGSRQLHAWRLYGGPLRQRDFQVRRWAESLEVGANPP